MEKNFEANEFRKNGDLDKAIQVYREVCGDYTDPYVTAGLLHCLRKTYQYDEAFAICNIIETKHLNSDWCRNEAIWTIVQGGLERLDEKASFEETYNLAKRVLKLEPKETKTKWRVIRHVLKSAKQHKRWDIIKEWTDLISPEQLSTIPMKDDNGREGWCEQAVWYNYKIRSLIEIGDKEEAITLSIHASELFPRQSRFFLRLVALAKLRLSRLQEAEQLYADLSNVPKPDWWILQEYAEVLKELGKNELALQWLCKAANLNNRLESLVSLFQDVGALCVVLNKEVEALNHYLLCKYIREKNGWSIPYAVGKSLEELKPQPKTPQCIKEALTSCRSFWQSTLEFNSSSKTSKFQKKIRYGIIGKVSLGIADRPFCFITEADNTPVFCLKNDLPVDIKETDTVIFDAVPSFDRKKNKESWKAVNIRAKRGTPQEF